MAKHDYSRDGRSPVPESDRVSRVMSSNKAKNTGPELMLRSALTQIGLRGYRLHWAKAPGRPDLAFPGRRRAVFVNGCFWHRCPHCRPSVPKTHVQYWRSKFERNQQRDQAKTRALKKMGWEVMTVWECELEADAAAVATRIRNWLETV